MTGHALLAAGLCLVAGIGIPVMAALNSDLGSRIGIAASAACLFVVAFSCAAGVLLLQGGVKVQSLFAPPGYLFLGGALVAFYVLTITTQAPKLGVATAVMIVLLGQIFSAAVIDHFGLLNAPRHPVTPVRLLGIVLMVAGIILARRAG